MTTLPTQTTTLRLREISRSWQTKCSMMWHWTPRTVIWTTWIIRYCRQFIQIFQSIRWSPAASPWPPHTAPNVASWTLNRQYQRRLMSRNLYIISPWSNHSHQTHLSLLITKVLLIVIRTSQLMNKLKTKDKLISRKDRNQYTQVARRAKDCPGIKLTIQGSKLSKHHTNPS